MTKPPTPNQTEQKRTGFIPLPVPELPRHLHLRRLELRNGVLVMTEVDVAAPTHFSLTRQELAAFVLGTRTPAAADALSKIDQALDRSHMMPPGTVESVTAEMKGCNAFEH